jgi:hypothetical protein
VGGKHHAERSRGDAREQTLEQLHHDELAAKTSEASAEYSLSSSDVARDAR